MTIASAYGCLQPRIARCAATVSGTIGSTRISQPAVMSALEQDGRWADMGLSRTDDELSVSFVHDDKERRLEFDRQLAVYIRRHRERWDITAVLEPLQLLRGRTKQVDVHLHRRPTGRLAVTMQFELELSLPTADGMRPASHCEPLPS
jgi:hypothetical protein